jgi:hypothetical protein
LLPGIESEEARCNDAIARVLMVAYPLARHEQFKVRYYQVSSVRRDTVVIAIFFANESPFFLDKRLVPCGKLKTTGCVIR